MAPVCRSLISLKDLTDNDVIGVLDLADAMAESLGFDDPDQRAAARPLDRILATLFFEASTRTRLSFESAMHRLGGQVLGFADPSATSAKKGESLADTIRMVSGYADIIVIRHPLAGSAKVAADYASVPVINGGDGPHEHPTQTLTDLFCIRRNKGTLQGLTVGLCGDLKYGRTVHSLAPMMARFNSDLICIAPEQLCMPDDVLDEVQHISGRRPREVATLEEVLPELDVLYMTRIQRERFERPEEYDGLKGVYVLTPELLGLAGEDAIVLHPLPRVDEIAPAADTDPRAKYFEQAAGGVPVRMALISLLLEVESRHTGKGSFRFGESAPPPDPPPGDPSGPPERVVSGAACSNSTCVTTQEEYLEPLVTEDDTGLRCAYCESRIL